MREHDRQGFLDPQLSAAVQVVSVGIVGFSGGGSHLGQQLAHNGFRDFVVFDPKVMEPKHLSRLVGGTHRDARRRVPKTMIAKRLISSIRPSARVQTFAEAWQSNPNPLKACDVILSAVDTFRGRRDLERFARQHCIPLVDIGIRSALATPDRESPVRSSSPPPESRVCGAWDSCARTCLTRRGPSMGMLVGILKLST